MEDKAARTNATAMGPLNPHDPYWGRFEGGGNAWGGVDGVRPGERTRDLYADLQAAREQAIKQMTAQAFGGKTALPGRVMQPADVLEANAATNFGRSQAITLNGSMNAHYGAKPDAYGAFSRSIQVVNSFAYEPRDAYTYAAKYTPAFGF